uniref:Uncharacterized protein n=1 Tax=Avena sativa TaxID=4498 RepID=A0ACD5UC96_AVESA
MAEALLLGVVRGVANKAADALVQSVTGMCGVEADRRKLERQLMAVQCKLADAEAKSKTNQYVKRWMQDLRTVAYQADDVLDDFLYEALRRQIQIGDSKTRKVLSHFTSYSPLAFRHTMSRKLNNVLEKIDKLVEEMSKFGLESHAGSPRVLYTQTHSGLDMDTEPVGREDDKGVVMRLLLDQEDQQKVQVLPIFGMGGLGKTTLAKMVYNDSKIQQHFQLRMWHCVSDNFEAISLVKSIIELATKETCYLPHTIELLRGRLQEVIGRRRFLLVLDDVLGEVQQIWEDSLKPLLCAVAGSGSVILVTTQSQRIASMMSTLGPHELACLSEEHSWELFSEKAFSKYVHQQAELITIGKGIVNKCKGLPLALKTMGGLMSSKLQVREWEAIAESNIGDNDRGKDEILSVLKLSYEHLSSEMKQCFAICAVFSKGFEMEKSMLIQLWMANGFVQQEQEGMMDLDQRGEFIFNELVWRSFLVEMKPFDHWASRHGLVGCGMHDLMHDLAKDVTDECATIEELLQHKAFMKDVSHIKVSSDELELSCGLLKDKNYLRTLLLPSSVHKDLHKLKPMFLRALSCGSPHIIHNQHLNAKHLRYLDLSHSEIARLPDSVCMLYNLQTLRLNHCHRLQYLPEGMRTMRNLKHLYLFECDKLERMPPNIGLLSNLRTLTAFVVDIGDGYGIQELKDLKHLGHRLELYNLIKIESGADAKQANLFQKKNLSELSLCWGRRKYNGPPDDVGNMEDVLEALAPYNELAVLEVHGYGGTKFSPWMINSRMCQCLKKLIIFNCPRCNDLPISHMLVSLEYLSLGGMDSLTTLCKLSDAEVEACSTSLQLFPKLKTIFLEDLPLLEIWAENSARELHSLVIFPQLEELSIHDCRKVASVPNSPILKILRITECCSLPISSLAHLSTLSELSYDGKGCCSAGIPLGCWPSLVKLLVSSLAYMTMMPLEEQQIHTPLKTLRSLWLYGPNCFETTSILSKLHLRPWGCFAFLQELRISECHELVHWPMDEFRHLICLRSLSISFCANLEGKCSSFEEEILPLPQLEMLSIYNCGSLPAIPMVPESLEELLIGECTSLVSLPSNLGNLAKLRALQIRGCNGLRYLPDGLTCLGKLTIERCPGVDTIPPGLLQRLPVLKSLQIVGCEDLQRCLIEGGEYFNLVSSIPCKDIPAPEKKSSKKSQAFLKRLLPSC